MIQGLLNVHHAADLIVEVDVIATQLVGEKRVGKIKLDVCKSLLSACESELRRNRIGKDQMKLFEEARGAVVKFTTLLEHSWLSAERLLSTCRGVTDTRGVIDDSDEDEDPPTDDLTNVMGVFDGYITAILGPPEERRAPHSRCAPLVKLRRPQVPLRPKLTSVLGGSIHKVQMLASLAKMQAHEEEWRNELKEQAAAE